MSDSLKEINEIKEKMAEISADLQAKREIIAEANVIIRKGKQIYTELQARLHALGGYAIKP